jgi:hypothetical protein
LAIGGGAALDNGGVIDAPQILGYANDFLEGCACAGVQPGDDVLLYGEGTDEYGEARFLVSCDEDTFDDPIPICCVSANNPEGCVDPGTADHCCAEGDFCTYIPTACSFTDIVGEILDVDLNGNGISNFDWTITYGADGYASAIDPRTLSFRRFSVVNGLSQSTKRGIRHDFSQLLEEG